MQKGYCKNQASIYINQLQSYYDVRNVPIAAWEVYFNITVDFYFFILFVQYI